MTRMPIATPAVAMCMAEAVALVPLPLLYSRCAILYMSRWVVCVLFCASGIGFEGFA